MTGPDDEPHPPGSRAAGRPVAGYARSPALRVVLLTGPISARFAEQRLVLRALGIAHDVVREGRQSLLVVPAQDALRAEQELLAYTRENPPRTEALGVAPAWRRGRGLPAVLAYALLLVGIHLATRPGAWASVAREQGLLAGAAVLQGEWQRVVTALCLHADSHHLASNLVFGALFLGLLAQAWGSGAACLAVLLGGALGNAFNVLLRAEPHRALGASTAVFAALGLVLAQSFRVRGQQGHRGLRRWAPLVMGLGLLGWLGTSGERTDIPAHLTGLLAGMALGLPLAHDRMHSLSEHGRRQALLGSLALALLAVCWLLALS